ncbi:hypothetical protein HBE96_17325 [Clostridium sp. P21]|uniref:Uncharacterized protein n=1 Tax=Clostridium muellerianum TaxID=2716538 RepID=A0A7Y0EJ23_9CLOT|nr:hypothetical protein [Clostridium muellerianum]NMM64384.1 hypothetical protein [Clostridium muellerianum]
MITKSLNKIAYITYKTGSMGDIIEDNKGMYLFQILDTEEINIAVDEYNKAVSLQCKLDVDMIEYNRIIHMYKNKVKEFKVKKAQDIIFNDKEFKLEWKKKEERLNRIDKICDKIINNLEN